MKKIHIVLAVLATAALTSCMQEKSFNGKTLDKGDVAFVLQSGPSTRSADLGSPVTKGINVPIGRVGNMNLYLEETVTDLNSFVPETRGVPVFTENVGKLYADKLFVHAVGGGFGDAVFGTDGMAGDGWRYSHHYGDKDPWPESGSVNFYLRIPSDMSGVTFNSDSYAAGAKTVFNYTSPLTAEAQQDIIFTGVTLDKATHDGKLPDGYPVTFYHALTAVKFAIANSATEAQNIRVTSISFTGLDNTGTCTVDPSADVKVSWTGTDATTTTTGEGEGAETNPNVIEQTFTTDDFVEFSAENNPDFGSSFFNAKTDKQNVNTQTASKTFWLIPQKFAGSTAVLRISYTFNGNAEYLDINMGQLMADVEWKPGQLRTYSIKLDEVNVKITDDVTPGEGANADNGYSGTYKNNVKIQNTGNTPAFIRAAIVGQWLDQDNNPVFGFTDNVNNLYIVESWYEDQFVNSGEGSHGIFEGLPGYKGTSTFKKDSESATADANGIIPGWQLCKDGYYYYTKIVDPQAYTGSNLFTKYTTLIAPKAELAGEVLKTAKMHFVLEISTQAITAVKMDGYEGSRYTWKEAWKNATGTEPVEK